MAPGLRLFGPQLDGAARAIGRAARHNARMRTETPVELSRRGFLRSWGAGVLLALIGRPLGARGIVWLDDGFPIPADKGFDQAWTRSLTARGEPTVYSSLRDELKYIGMPIGGVCCGQVYLGGDGRLWHWDILNLPQEAIWTSCSGDPYVNPPEPRSPFRQSFGLQWSFGTKLDEKPSSTRLDRRGFRNIAFRGQYPIGLVNYKDAECPLAVEQETFSPFCPLDVEGSSLPAIVVNHTIKNTSGKHVALSMHAELQNPVCIKTGLPADVRLTSRFVAAGPGVAVVHGAEPKPAQDRPDARPDIVFEDWENAQYKDWVIQGRAFGIRPRNLVDIAAYQGDLNAQGKWVLNTHETRSGEDVVKGDSHVGTLTSREFTIERDWIRFRIGGGNHPGQTCINLLVDGVLVRTETGRDNNRMRLDHWNVKELAGKKGTIQIVDNSTGAWGNVGIDEIVFTDVERLENYDIERAPDFGTMAMGTAGAARCRIGGAEWDTVGKSMTEELSSKPVAHLTRDAVLKPGESVTLTTVIAWHFPNPPREQLGFLKNIKTLKHHYAARFKDAHEVVTHVLKNLDELTRVTRLWRDTWYDSTLPYWFLDRTFATVATAATATCYRFDNGRFYGWEGTYSCAGTCTHVWQYAQSLARVFPELERTTREHIDFDQEFDAKSGVIHYRGEAARELAIDGQCGTIIRAYREHTMASDDRFLKAVYPNVKKAMQLVISRDVNQDGILDGPQYNTLDTTWYGEIAWITSLFLAALRTTAAMATDAGDKEFAAQCITLADKGRTAMVERLFNGEYFIHKPDPAHPQANSTGTGCHIDQVFGQSMAFQAGLTAPDDRVVPRDQTILALKSLYKYNLATDVGVYRAYSEKTIKGGRWYAVAGEGGLLMCTWPKGGSEAATGKSGDAWAAGYFNECMNGFEHQVASHMLAEGLVHEGLAVTRLLHDRHHASKRNPWNEIECGNHYSRSMAAYGSFVTACGFAWHGPKGELRFDPKVLDVDAPEPNRFKAAFITAAAWGSYEQIAANHRITVAHGTLTLRQLELPDLRPATNVDAWSMKVGDRIVPGKFKSNPELDGVRKSLTITFDPALVLDAGQTLNVGG